MKLKDRVPPLPAEIRKLIETIEEAKSNKMLLVEKRVEDRSRGILETKSW